MRDFKLYIPANVVMYNLYLCNFILGKKDVYTYGTLELEYLCSVLLI